MPTTHLAKSLVVTALDQATERGKPLYCVNHDVDLYRVVNNCAPGFS